MRICGRCKESKPESEYGISRTRRDGLNLYCKVCIREKIAEQRRRKREYLAENPRVPATLRPKPITDGSIDAGLLLLSLVAPRGIELELQDIAYVCGCTPGRIAQIQQKAMQKLRDKIQSDPRFLAA